MTFKENGCIIFISALSPTELIVTSKHSLDSLKGDEPLEQDEIGGEEAGPSSLQRPTVSHAGKGEEWVDVHLKRAGKSREQLAEELWRRGETAVAELCDDSFEEHVLPYPPEKSGLHLHGLNSNSVSFQTRSMEDVEALAREWGFIPTRYLTLSSMKEVNEFTDRVGTTGEWQGEAIEGFVVRTHIPKGPVSCPEGAAAPPYDPGQAWFYKVKFDEPYLMYRDWRELSKKMLNERTKWAKQAGEVADSKGSADQTANLQSEGSNSVDISTTGANGEKKSKNQLRKEIKARQAEEHRQAAARRGTVPLPPPPKARSNRPETKLFIEWCYSKLHGSEDGKVKPNLAIFDGLTAGKGIIRLRDLFLAYLESDEGKIKLDRLGGAQGALAARLNGGHAQESTKTPESPVKEERPYTHLLVVPIAVPGCGKTSLFIALSHLYPKLFAHTQSDDVKSKKTAPTFLKNICAELKHSPIVLADRNNQLLQHRDEIVETVRAWEDRGGKTEEELKAELKAARGGKKRGTSQQQLVDASNDVANRPRVKLIGLTWSLDLLPLNTLHRMMSDRILARGDNHQSLLADTVSATGSRSHETILWRFLESLETLGSAEGKGEGSQGTGDAQLDEVIRLKVETSQEEQLTRILHELSRIVKETLPERDLPLPLGDPIKEALGVARGHKVTIKKVDSADGKLTAKEKERAGLAPRYYGLAVEVDLLSLIPAFLEAARSQTNQTVVKRAEAMFDSLRSARRVISRPHITLVHSSALQDLSQEEQAALSELQRSERASGRAKWVRYSALAASGSHIDFDIELSHLVFDNQVMAFGVADVMPSRQDDLSAEEFWRLQGGKGGVEQGRWRPHITIGTKDESIRPFEANRVMREAEQKGAETEGSSLGLIDGEKGKWNVKGRLMGLNS